MTDRYLGTAIVAVLILLTVVLLLMSSSYDTTRQELRKANKTIKELKQQSIKDQQMYATKLAELVVDKNLEFMIKDLKRIRPDLRKATLGLCFTESSLRYSVKHTSEWDKTTVGICGIKPELWRRVLGNVDPNSLYAGSLILDHLLDRFNGDMYKTIKYYKGVRKNTALVDKTIAIIDKL